MDKELREISFIVRVLQRYWRLTRGLKLDVSACVIDDDKNIRLAKDDRSDGWQLLCGGVRGGETSQGALRRVLRNEFGIEIVGNPELLEITPNETRSNAHYVAHFLVRHWRIVPARAGIETVKFSVNDLPSVSAATRTRIESAVKGRAPAET